ncbi:hypothetical protein BS329_15715 [Amycolatopsis coloradensis]|uniref:DUF8175 domain-containing protein n=2 Tax=Amycolatopsis coloradensis TaxID=76021 RepID=A0A1R0KUA8_9PSEU|nr:hypothetical protein BS329_15715 [Amycolatopsis coloradensis]
MAAHRRPRRWWIVAVLIVAAVAGTAGWLISRNHDAPAASPPQPVPPPALSPATPPPASATARCQVRWDPTSSGDHAPVSDCAGPRDSSGGRARGFSHDRDGAVFAAINITLRLAATAGPSVYRPTYAEQTVGDAQSAMSELAQQETDTPAAETRPTQWWWRIGAGDPTAELVVVDLAVATPQTAASESFARVSIALQWVSGDWKVQLPLPRASLHSTVDGYTSLGVVPRGGR